ncbi:hypothetical protein TNCV_2570351 [Trichonephila clavipes]|nr:hypothetical protein TNCV_2570351 [Trichonephila clavipes]
MHSNADVTIRKRNIKIPRDRIIKRKSRKIKVEEQLSENLKSKTDNTEGIEIDSLDEKESQPINIKSYASNKMFTSFFKTNENSSLPDTSFQNEENNKKDSNIDIEDLQESFGNKKIGSHNNINANPSFLDPSFQNEENNKKDSNIDIEDLQESFGNKKIGSPNNINANPSFLDPSFQNEENNKKGS